MRNLRSPGIARREFILGSSLAALGCAGRVVEPDFPKTDPCGPECARVDVHCHVFNGSDLPISGFLTHVAPVPEKWTTSLALRLEQEVQKRAPTGAVELAQLNEMLEKRTMALAPTPRPHPEYAALALELRSGVTTLLGEDASDDLDRYTDVLAMVMRPRHQVAAEIVQTYPAVDLFTPLLVDYDYFAKGTPRTTLHDQLRVHSKLSELSMEGLLGRAEARLHPFAPFNPLREANEVMADQAYKPFGSLVIPGLKYECNLPTPDKLEETKGSLQPLRHAIERLGFVGAKVYPPVGFLPLGNAGAGIHADTQVGQRLDQALRAFYAYCEAEQVPVTTHAANSNGYHLGYGVLAEPGGWASVLREFPKLHLNLGHFGHVFGVPLDDDRGITACEAWLRQACVLMESYDNVYADVSNSPLPSLAGYADQYLPLLAGLFEAYPKTRKRLLYGSDWWMNKLDANHTHFLDAFSAAFGTKFPDAKADLLGNNALRFLGLLDEQNQKNTTHRNHRRLSAFYGKRELPRWM